MVDAPLGRTPREAELGRLNTFVGGDPEAVARVKPIIACYADTIIEAGPIGSGHTLKLVNNFISIGTSAVIAEAVATAAKLGVDMRTLYQVVSSGGADSRMFQMMMPWVLEGDDCHLKGPLRIAGKDLRFYCRMAEIGRGAGLRRAGGLAAVSARQCARPRRALHADAARDHRRADRRAAARAAVTDQLAETASQPGLGPASGLRRAA